MFILARVGEKRCSEIRLKCGPPRQFRGIAAVVNLDDNGIYGGGRPVTDSSDDHCRHRYAEHAGAEEKEPERKLGVVVEHAGALSAAVGLPEHARAVEDESHYQRTWDCA